MHAGMQGYAMPLDGAINQAAAGLRLLADPSRMKILWALAQGDSNVSCLAELAGVSPTGVSQHLAKLRLAGLVTTRREGTFVSISSRTGTSPACSSPGEVGPERGCGSRPPRFSGPLPEPGVHLSMHRALRKAP